MRPRTNSDRDDARHVARHYLQRVVPLRSIRPIALRPSPIFWAIPCPLSLCELRSEYIFNTGGRRVVGTAIQGVIAHWTVSRIAGTSRTRSSIITVIGVFIAAGHTFGHDLITDISQYTDQFFRGFSCAVRVACANDSAIASKRRQSVCISGFPALSGLSHAPLLPLRN